MKINLEGVRRRDGEPFATVIFGSLVLPLMPPWCCANLTYLGLISWGDLRATPPSPCVEGGLGQHQQVPGFG